MRGLAEGLARSVVHIAWPMPRFWELVSCVVVDVMGDGAYRAGHEDGSWGWHSKSELFLFTWRMGLRSVMVFNIQRPRGWRTR